MTKFVLSPEEAEKVRTWFRDGRGCYRWVSKDLSAPRPDMVTPGDADKAPHWAYVGAPTQMTPEDFEVRTRTEVPLVPEWYPKCQYCECGKRTVKRLAEIRKESVTDTMTMLVQDGRTVWVGAGNEVFQCWACRGTGHEITRPTARWVRRPMWRSDVSDTGKAKFNKIAARLKAHYRLEDEVIWDYQHIENGCVEATFFTEKVEPFTV